MQNKIKLTNQKTSNRTSRFYKIHYLHYKKQQIKLNQQTPKHLDKIAISVMFRYNQVSNIFIIYLQTNF